MLKLTTILIRGRFDNYQAFKQALEKLKTSGFASYEAFGPIDLAELSDLMPRKGSPIRTISTFGIFLGLAAFWLMCITTSWIYDLVVGGKPPVSNVPFVIVGFDGAIITAIIFALLIFFFLGRLGPHKLPVDYDPRYSENNYGISIRCGLTERGRVVDILKQAGAVEVDEPA